jgi:hypothetical protein
VVRATHLGLLAPDYLRAFEPSVAEASPSNGSARTTFAGLGERDIDESIVSETRAEGDVQQPALTLRKDLRHAGKRLG